MACPKKSYWERDLSQTDDPGLLTTERDLPGFDFMPTRRIFQVVDYVRKAQLEGKATTRKQQLDLVEKWMKENG